MEPVLSATGLIKTYKASRAVDGVTLSVAPGERVALLGPNGAGKTTTLLMLLGAIRPDAGRVVICGYELPEEHSQAMTNVGFAAGYLPLPDRLTVGEVLRLFADLYGVADSKAAVQEGLERFRIPHLIGRMATELSSGQRTLVGIVKATMHRPRLLVLDEPTASLDPDVAQRVRDGLEDLWTTDGTAMLITSHDMTDVERVCERVVFLSRGRIEADGPPDSIADHFGQSSLEEVFYHLSSQEEL